jgi:hypothetical protein
MVIMFSINITEEKKKKEAGVSFLVWQTNLSFDMQDLTPFAVSSILLTQLLPVSQEDPY